MICARARRMAGTLVLVLLAVSVAACAAEDYALDLDVGDCFDDPPSLASGVREVPVVDCEEPHDNQVFAVLELPEDAYPGVTAINTFADAECASAFADYVGVDYLASDLLAYYFPPNEASWEAGHRRVVCYLFDDGGPLEGSVQGAAR